MTTGGTSAPPARRAGLAGRLLRAWDDYFFTVEPVYAAVAYRVVLAVYTACFFLPRLPYLAEFYEDRGLQGAYSLIERLGLDPLPLAAVWVLLAVLFAALAAFAAGVRPRLAHAVVLLTFVYLLGFDVSSLFGFGKIMFFQWLLAAFLPYDRLTDPTTGQVVRAPRWATRLVGIQFASIYVWTVLAKVFGGAGWFDGAAIYWSWHGDDYGRFLLSEWVHLSWPVARVLGWWTLLTELFIGFGLLVRRTRLAAMIVCVAFHLSLLVSLSVTPLFPMLMIGHLVLFVPPGTYERWLARRRRVPAATPLRTAAGGAH